MEVHRAAGVPVGARASRDRERRVGGIVERALDRDLPTRQERRPVALPGLADDGADALALVAAYLLPAARVEDLVREGERVADRVAGRRKVDDGVRRGTLEDMDPLPAP